MGVIMPALLGYLVALSMLIGGAYAALDWLVAPENRTAVTERSSRHPQKSASTETVPEPGEADRKGNARNPAGPTSGKQSDQASYADTAGQAGDEHLKVENSQGEAAGGCTPTGITANGDFVFSIRCQNLIQHHPGEMPSSPAVHTAPSDGKDQAVKSANSEAYRDTVEVGPSNNEAVGRTSSDSKAKGGAGERKQAKRNKPVRMKSFAAALGNAQGTDRWREQRPMARSRRMAQPAEPDWYNALGLR
jgi:hypothetical protein